MIVHTKNLTHTFDNANRDLKNAVKKKNVIFLLTCNFRYEWNFLNKNHIYC